MRALRYCVLGLVLPCLAQTQADVDAAKLRADLAEQVKREAEAREAAVKADAEAAAAGDTARATAAKAQTDADKAKADYLKSLLPTAPDPSKYRVAIPGVPQVTATASGMTYDEAHAIALDIAAALAQKLDQRACSSEIIIAEDAKNRGLVTLYRSTSSFLTVANVRLTNAAADVRRRLKPADQRTAASAAIIPAAVSSLAEMAVAYANILKTQYASSAGSLTATADDVIAAKVCGKLQERAKAIFIDPDQMIVIVPDPDNLAPSDPKLLGQLKTLKLSINDARAAVSEAMVESAKRRSSAPTPTGDDDKRGTEARKKALADADEIDAAAKELTAKCDDVDKAITSMFTPDAQGATVFDTSLRGELLSKRIADKSSCTFVISTKVVASNYDVFAADSLFRGLRAAVSSETITKYRMSMPDGTVLVSGALSKNTSLKRVAIPE